MELCSLARGESSLLVAGIKKSAYNTGEIIYRSVISPITIKRLERIRVYGANAINIHPVEGLSL